MTAKNSHRYAILNHSYRVHKCYICLHGGCSYIKHSQFRNEQSMGGFAEGFVKSVVAPVATGTIAKKQQYWTTDGARHVGT